MDVAVIGAGFWGTFIGQALRQSGLEVEWFDGGYPGAASLAAAGLVRTTSWKGPLAHWWQASHEKQCRDYFDQHGQLLCEHLVSDYNPLAREQAPIWTCRPLLTHRSARPWRVQRLSLHGKSWKLQCQQGSLTVKKVVVACGYWCGPLLSASQLPSPPLRALGGRALIFQGSPPEGVLTRAFRLPGESRTRKLSIQRWGFSAGDCRVGDTLEPPEQGLLDLQLAELQKTVALIGAKNGGPERWLWGLRPMLAELFVEEVRQGLIVATGGGRRGLAVAPAVAQRVLQLWRLS